MNFFERQRQVRRMSTRLVILFVVAVIGIIAAVDLASALAFSRSADTPGQLVGILVVTSLLTLVAIVLAAGFRMIGLRGGGGVVARELGGVLVPQDTADPQLRRLRNVVEEIAIASGTPVPEIYLLANERGINAFAAGWSTSDAAVAVTRGALERLNRAELQGVIAHEFSHVVNGDMRLNIRLMGLLFGILFLSVIGRTLAYTGHHRRLRQPRATTATTATRWPSSASPCWWPGSSGSWSAGSSRPPCPGSASTWPTPRRSSSPARPAASSARWRRSPAWSPDPSCATRRARRSGTCSSAPARRASSFATHPPLLERIKVLDPTFDTGKLDQLSRQWAVHPPQGLAEDMALGLAPAAPAALPAHDADRFRSPSPMWSVASAPPRPSSFERAEQLIAQIPPQFLDRARDAGTVVPLILGLLLSDHEEARTVQHALIAGQYGRELADAAWTQANDLTGLHPLLRLPLAELAVPGPAPAVRRPTVHCGQSGHRH